MASHYWSLLLDRRTTRRRGLAAMGGLAAGAAFLAACGGSSSDNKTSGGGQSKAAGLVYDPSDTTKTAKRGGAFKTRLSVEPLNFDLYNFNASLQPFSNVVGSELLKMKPGHMEPPSLAVEGDLAQSWELSPDHLTLTMKLHPQAKWSPLSRSYHDGLPQTAQSIANRPIDAEDVMFSWERFKSTPTANGRLDLVNELSPSAPVQSLVKVDDKTIQFKLVRPYVPMLLTLARPNVGYFYILPKEGRNNGIDFIKYQFGAGPFYIDRYEPSVGITLRRNPNFEARDTEFKRPFVDTVDLPLVTETAQWLAQYRAGNIYVAPGTNVIGAEEVLKLKKDFPDHDLIASYTSQGDVCLFGSHQDSPFKDVRVRQAFSYSWDRDLLIDVLLSADKLEAAGIPTNKRWHSAMPCNEEGWPNGTYKGWWLDPKSKDFGENAKYFSLGDRAKDIAEGKKLMAAAGFANGASFDYNVNGAFGPPASKAADVVIGMAAEVGLKGQKKILTPADVIGIYTTTPRGNWQGILQSFDPTAPDPGTYLWQLYNKGGLGNAGFQGYNPNSTGVSTEGDPTVNEITDKLMTEFDEKKRVQLVFEFTRHHAKMNYRPKLGGGSNTIVTSWPALRNQRIWLGDSLKRDWSWEWLDDTKAPLKRA